MNIHKRDDDGYLVDSSVWSPEIAEAMAQADGVSIEEEEWYQILQARKYYTENGKVPSGQGLPSLIPPGQLKNSEDWINRPAKCIAKYAGLPRPTRSMLSMPELTY